ncbi:hypothetical protein A3K80_08845 [Candidatus Bathyarchaeota archaeon RBG_13_38_9]|nr:MAG: hypothetical protein A3K80_08845 [Candidatus Bathyarchaeota archaeon RBG_13_38_9]
MRIKKVKVTLLLVLFAVALVAEPLPVNATSSLIQQNSTIRIRGAGGYPIQYTPGNNIFVPFSSDVASGNVIVVAVQVSNGPYTAAAVVSVVDSRGSSFTQAVHTSNGPMHAYIYYATLSSSGPDTVTATFNVDLDDYGGFSYLFIYEVSGVNTTSVATATGSGTIPNNGPVSTTSTSFENGAFLVAIMGCDVMTANWEAGSGFTMSTVLVPFEDTYIQLTRVMYATSGVSSPTTFPATLNHLGDPSDENWYEAAIALNPATRPVPNPYHYVGGEVFSANKLAILSPYLALFSVVAIAAIIVGRKLT